MNTYTEFENLQLKARIGYAWPTSTVSRSVMLSFMEFMKRYNYYCMTTVGFSGEIWIVDLFYQTLQDAKLDFHVHPEDIYSFGARGTFELILSQWKDKVFLSLAYGLDGDMDELSMAEYLDIALDRQLIHLQKSMYMMEDPLTISKQVNMRSNQGLPVSIS